MPLLGESEICLQNSPFFGPLPMTKSHPFTKLRHITYHVWSPVDPDYGTAIDNTFWWWRNGDPIRSAKKRKKAWYSAFFNRWRSGQTPSATTWKGSSLSGGRARSSSTGTTPRYTSCSPLMPRRVTSASSILCKVNILRTLGILDIFTSRKRSQMEHLVLCSLSV